MADSPHIVDVTRENFAQLMEISFDVPVLMDFWASWCQPCVALMPVLARLAEEYEGKFLLAKLNTEEQQEIAAQFGIRSIPTVKLFRDGQPVDEFMGALPEQAVRQFLDQHVASDPDSVRDKVREHFASQVADVPGTSELEARLEKNADDLEALFQLALRKLVDGDHEPGMDLLLDLLRKDRSFEDDAARRTLLELFELLGNDPLVSGYRRRMASLLY